MQFQLPRFQSTTRSLSRHATQLTIGRRQSLQLTRDIPPITANSFVRVEQIRGVILLLYLQQASVCFQAEEGLLEVSLVRIGLVRVRASPRRSLSHRLRPFLAEIRHLRSGFRNGSIRIPEKTRDDVQSIGTPRMVHSVVWRLYAGRASGETKADPIPAVDFVERSHGIEKRVERSFVG